MSDLTPLSYSSVQRVQALHQTTALWRLLREPEVQVFDVRLDDDVKKLPRLAPRAQRLSPKEAAEQAGPALVFCHTGLKLSHGTAAWMRAVGEEAHVVSGGMVSWIDAALPTVGSRLLSASGLWTLSDAPSASFVEWLIARFLPPRYKVLRVPKADSIAVSQRFSAPILNAETVLDVLDISWPPLRGLVQDLASHNHLLRVATPSQSNSLLDCMLTAHVAGEQTT